MIKHMIQKGLRVTACSALATVATAVMAVAVSQLAALPHFPDSDSVAAAWQISDTPAGTGWDA